MDPQHTAFKQYARNAVWTQTDFLTFEHGNNNMNQSENAISEGHTRRSFMRASAPAAALPFSMSGAAAQSRPASVKRPNIVMIIADQFRWDFLGAYGLNNSTMTPNLDHLARNGVAFRNAVTNQPLCSPARACLFTGQYATQAGVWKLGFGLPRGTPTLAGTLRDAGYTANYIGKWHLAPSNAQAGQDLGPVAPQERGGFLDLWEASNIIELTSHPYEGTLWDGDGKPMHFKDIYRVDYLTDRAVRFLKQPQEKPFFLVVSQLEPHFQNDENAFIAPKGYAERYKSHFVPRDLRPFADGDWQAQLPGYYGDIQKIDESVGAILKTLEEQHLSENTIIAFLSDHGCHFRTRNAEYKRSPHESSVHIPLVFYGPGFNQAQMVTEIASIVDIAPTLLEAAGVQVPGSVHGHSLVPLVSDHHAREQWKNEAFIQISESMVARALRTDRWTYCVVDPKGEPNQDSGSTHYQEYQLYDLAADPHQLFNLAGRRAYRDAAAQLRERLIARMIEAGEASPHIEPARYYA
jgi:arylsulfatase A-like enzyme